MNVEDSSPRLAGTHQSSISRGPRVGFHNAARLTAIVVIFVTFVGLDLLELGRHEPEYQASSVRHIEPIEPGAVNLIERNSKAIAKQFNSQPPTKENETSVVREALITASSGGTESAGENAERAAEISANAAEQSSNSENDADKERVEKKAMTEVGPVPVDAHVYRNAPWKQHVGQWLSQCGGTGGLVSVKEFVFGRACPDECSSNGVCNYELGRCFCRQGYTGPGCAELVDLECNLAATDGFPLGRWVVSICSGWCDKRNARCLCGADSPFPNRPAVDPCGFAKNEQGQRDWGVVDPQLMYATDSTHPGWCMADPEQMRRGAQPRQMCYCNYDGATGLLCELPTRAYCLGGCNGHGECHMGFCQCEGGWYGIDCSIPSEQAVVKDPAPPWLKGERTQGGKAGPSSGGVLQSTLRRRPLIYVYELPPRFNSQQLQGRKWKFYCAPWLYSAANSTEFNMGMLYGMEAVVYEALLGSTHRTTNAAEADYFYVPVLTGCLIARAGDSPGMSMQGDLGKRPSLMSSFVVEAYEHIRAEYPFWNRSQGRDHIWMYPWDEGACYAPQVIWNSIMLSPWGNTMTKHKTSTTAYLDDSWDAMSPALRGPHPCFDPEKDIVLPAWKAPNVHQMRGRYWERPYEERPRLFYFNGNLGSAFPHGRPEPRYSMGIRQNVALLFASVADSSGKKGELAEDGVEVTPTRSADYASDLASSLFCGVFPGDGFSARMEDSVLHGCIPVIVQDGIQLPFENMLDYGAFAVRIAEADIPNLVTILKAIPEERVRAMLTAVSALWQRWAYSSVARQEAQQQQLWHDLREDWAVEVEALQGDDAIATLVQILHYKLYNDPWRKNASDILRKKELGIPESCVQAQ